MSNQITAKIIMDSISSITGTRLTTMELKFHRFILPEFNTHRVFSRNASSSRAIPVKKLLTQVRDNPMMPVHWGSNKPGMQAGEELTDNDLHSVQSLWLDHAKDTVNTVESLDVLHLHKQVANRLLEPFLPIKVVVTSTEWTNFFALREHKDAQPEIQELAHKMHLALDLSTPNLLIPDEWHLPYLTAEEIHTMNLTDAQKASAARCARVSYLNHDKTECLLTEDLKLFNMLATRPFDDGKGHTMDINDPVHLSPLEHQATPINTNHISKYYDKPDITHVSFNGKFGTHSNELTHWSGNLRNWIQFRQTL